MFWLQLLAAIKYNDAGWFCVSFVCQVLRAYKTLCQLREKKTERERTECLTKKSEKSKEKKSLMTTLELKKTYSDDDYSSST